MRPPQKTLPTTLSLKSTSTLNRTLRTKAYGNYIKRTLIILRYKHLRMLIGLQLRDLNNCSNIMEYGSLTKRASQYHKHCTTSLTRTTIRNGQMQKSSYISTTKDPSIRMLSTVVSNYAHLPPPLGHLNHLLHLHPSKLLHLQKLLRLHKLRLRKPRLRKLRPHKPRPRKLRPRKPRLHKLHPRKLR